MKKTDLIITYQLYKIQKKGNICLHLWMWSLQLLQQFSLNKEQKVYIYI